MMLMPHRQMLKTTPIGTDGFLMKTVIAPALSQAGAIIAYGGGNASASRRVQASGFGSMSLCKNNREVIKINTIKKRSYPIYFVLPGSLLFVCFFLIPFFVAFGYSFTNWNFRSAQFVGLQNYVNIVTDPDINISIKNTFIFTAVTSTGKMLFGMLLALFLNRRSRLTNYLRTVFYLPAVINTVAVGIVFTALMHPSRGLINKGFEAIGLGFMAQNWLTDPKLAIFSVCAIEIWKWSGYTMMLLLAGLQNVASEYYEAGDIDGANGWQKFWKITFPLVLPSFNNALVLNLIGGLKVFDIIVATTGGGPGVTTQVLNTMIYKSYSFNLQGQASAGTIALAGIVVVITMFTYRFIARREVEL